jgi:serine-type D-Ala-D-Ala carboxypeptidase/endopeptidase (penicillin-binding protein 4)
MKLFTTATALSRFGPEARIATRVLAEGKLDGRGVLHGNLYLKGGGDPALGTPAFYDRFLGGLGTDLYALKQQIKAAGVTAVTGRLYADDTVFDRRRGVLDSGYATSPYIGPLSGLSLNSGYSTAAARSFASDPAKIAASKLVASLRAAGVRMRRRIALGDADESTTRTVAVVRSPTIDQLVAGTDVYSNNFFAEMLLKLIGAEFGSGGTTAAGATVVERFARGKGSAVHAVDGSGLTRGNRASPLQVVRLLRAMQRTPDGEDFTSDLALTGRSGTVAQRMRGTAAEGRCRVKTGTLTGVSNLSGYCFNASGRELIFSVLMGSVGSLDLAHYEQDRIAAAVARR